MFLKRNDFGGSFKLVNAKTLVILNMLIPLRFQHNIVLDIVLDPFSFYSLFLKRNGLDGSDKLVNAKILFYLNMYTVTS